MNTPICDFVKKYSESDFLRLHMPGHKGKSLLGFESLDITEISGADSLFEASGIIAESEKNASLLFGSDTFYSVEGSSLSIRAMLYLAVLYAKRTGRKPTVLAGRNAHRVFSATAAVLGFETEWIFGDGGYLSCGIDLGELDRRISETNATAVYITSPDYTGNMADVEGISRVCKKHDCLLLVDNAHGAYLKFLKPSMHPIDLGADICCDSAHKTLPALTGGAYLHISDKLPGFFRENAKRAMALFGSTSPSYIILQSLDAVNACIADGYSEKLNLFVKKVSVLKSALSSKGFVFFGDEPLKLTVLTKKYGYMGFEFADELRKRKLECEFSDPDFVVLMITPEISDDELERVYKAFCDIEKREEISVPSPSFSKPERRMSVRDAAMSDSELLSAEDCVGRVVADLSVGCPPAVPILVCGEVVDESAIECFKYYGIDNIYVIKRV